MRTRLFQIYALLMVVLLGVSLWGCVPKAKRLDAPITDDIQAGMTSGKEGFSHEAFDALLRRHVSADGARVDYQGLTKDLPQLDAYLGALAKANLRTLSSDELKALLINAYNAYTLKLIVSNKSVSSIRDIDDPWETQAYEVGGHTVSLDNLEHGLLRPLYRDPRIHFAVNCASVGCPALRPQAFTGEQVDAQLEEATKDTLSNPAYVRVKGDTLMLTSILDWYGGDFTDSTFKGHAETVAAYVAKYATPQVAQLINSKGGDPKVEFLDYDWKLNKK